MGHMEPNAGSCSDSKDQSAQGKESVVMDLDVCDLLDNDDFDLDTDDELERQFFEAVVDDQDTPGEKDSPVHHLEASSSSGSSSYKPSKVEYFVSMGFAEKMVIRAIKENGENNEEAILNSILTYSALEDFPGQNVHSSELSEDSSEFSEDLSDCGSDVVTEFWRDVNNDDKTISVLVDLGYQIEDAVIAIERCGHDTPIDVLADFINAAEIAKGADVTEFRTPIQPAQSQHAPIQTAQSQQALIQTAQRRRAPIQNAQSWPIRKRRVFQEAIERVRKRPERRIEVRRHKLMIGYGVPGCLPALCYRKLPDDIVGPPYFYYENVALTPIGVWETISRFLYDIEPEFVDSIHFSAAARKRGYVHNLPVMNRQPLLPIPPKTIHEALPDTEKWWPSWDKRTKLNCLLTCIGSAQLTERIRKTVQYGEPSEEKKKWVIEQCKKWNLVWVGKNRAAVLEPGDMEMLLGFPRNHTRGLSRTDRYKTLGNSFQVDTVAYHLSVLKPMYPNGMNILSLFSGIGGAEIALHKLGITLKNVVSVESSRASRKVLQDWWEETGLEGKLIHVDDVQKVDCQMIDGWIEEFKGFDLVIGGSPCNNLAGGNRRTRDGLDGEHSSLFYEYYRIVDYVRHSMTR